jgi:hypothetical protein
VITESIAYVFVNTESKGLPYLNAVERGKFAESLLKKTLQFNRVEVFMNLTKEETIGKLGELQ